MQAPQVGQYKTTQKRSKIVWCEVSQNYETVRFRRADKKTGSHNRLCELDQHVYYRNHCEYINQEYKKDFDELGQLLRNS